MPRRRAANSPPAACLSRCPLAVSDRGSGEVTAKADRPGRRSSITRAAGRVLGRGWHRSEVVSAAADSVTHHAEHGQDHAVRPRCLRRLAGAAGRSWPGGLGHSRPEHGGRPGSCPGEDDSRPAHLHGRAPRLSGAACCLVDAGMDGEDVDQTGDGKNPEDMLLRVDELKACQVDDDVALAGRDDGESAMTLMASATSSSPRSTTTTRPSHSRVTRSTLHMGAFLLQQQRRGPDPSS
jgi:hypothetical protein